MTTDATAGATQADATATTSAQAATTTTPTTQAVGGKQPLSADEYERKLAEANREAAANRVALKKYQEAEEAAKLAAMGDVEKANKQLADAQKQIQQLRDENVKAQIRLQAKTLGIANDELISPYVLSKLEFDDDGKPTNLDKVLDEVIKNNPNLVVNKPDAGTPAAQTAGLRTPPTTPANNPGRSSIVQPGTLPANKIMKFADMDWKK